MSFIHIIHPTRNRPEKSVQAINNFVRNSDQPGEVMVTVCLDDSDPRLSDYWKLYRSDCSVHWTIDQRDNKSSVEAINNGLFNSLLRIAPDQIIMVVSEDLDCFKGWDTALIELTNGKTNWVLKTQDGIQDYIITQPIMDGVYYDNLLKLQGGLYHPGFKHLFCDSFLTCQADILGRKITSKLMFRHNHYSHSGGKEGPDELHKRNDATWAQGEELFIKLISQYSIEDRRKISDPGMKNWLRRKGVQI